MNKFIPSMIIPWLRQTTRDGAEFTMLPKNYFNPRKGKSTTAKTEINKMKNAINH